MTPHDLIRRVSSFLLHVAAILLAMLVLAGARPALAASDNVPPGLEEYRQVGRKVLQSHLPASLAGMKRVQVLYNPPFMSGAVYTGGAPVATLGLVVSWSPGSAEFNASMQNQVKQGDAAVLTRNGRTVYLTGAAVESASSGAPGVAVLAGDRIVAIKGKPTGGAMPEAKAVRAQLLSVLDAVDVERVADFRPAAALLTSARIEVRGGVDATLQVKGANVNFIGGFTDTRWSVNLGDASRHMAVRLFYLPADIGPGTYRLHEQPALMSGNAKSVISAKFRVAESSANPRPGYWDEDVTGTLVVESVENDRMTGHFVFQAHRDDAPPVEVKGQFVDLVILDGRMSGP